MVSYRCYRLTSGKVHEGTAVGILDRVYVVVTDLGNDPELSGDPGVGELALLISLNLGPWNMEAAE